MSGAPLRFHSLLQHRVLPISDDDNIDSSCTPHLQKLTVFFVVCVIMCEVYPFLNANSLIVILARRAFTAILLPLQCVDLPLDSVPGADPVQGPHTPGHSLIILHLPQHNVTLLAEGCLTLLQSMKPSYDIISGNYYILHYILLLFTLAVLGT